MDENTKVFTGSLSDGVEVYANKISDILDALCGKKFTYILIMSDQEGYSAIVSPWPTGDMRAILGEAVEMIDAGKTREMKIPRSH